MSYVDTALMLKDTTTESLEDEILKNKDDLNQRSKVYNIKKQDDQDPHAWKTPGTILDPPTPTTPIPNLEQSDRNQECSPDPDHLCASTTPLGDSLTCGQLEIPTRGSTAPFTGLYKTNQICDRRAFDGDMDDRLVSVPGGRDLLTSVLTSPVMTTDDVEATTCQEPLLNNTTPAPPVEVSRTDNTDNLSFSRVTNCVTLATPTQVMNVPCTPEHNATPPTLSLTTPLH